MNELPENCGKPLQRASVWKFRVLGKRAVGNDNLEILNNPRNPRNPRNFHYLHISKVYEILMDLMDLMDYPFEISGAKS